MKKIISLTLIVVMVLSATFTCFGVNIKIDDKHVQFTESSGAPFIDSANRTQVPLRVTMEAYGCKVDWDGDTRTAIVEKNGIVVKVPIGQSYILVNGVKKTNDTAAVIKDNRTYLPIRAVLEAFGANVGWDQSTQTVTVSSDGNSSLRTNCAVTALKDLAKTKGEYVSSEKAYTFTHDIDSQTTQYLSYFPENESVAILTYTDYPSKKMTTTDILILDMEKFPCTGNEAYFECYSEMYKGSTGKTYSAYGTISKSNFVADKTSHFTSINTSDETVKRISSVGIGLSLLYLEEYCLSHNIDFTASDLGYKNLY